MLVVFMFCELQSLSQATINLQLLAEQQRLHSLKLALCQQSTHSTAQRNTDTQPSIGMYQYGRK